MYYKHETLPKLSLDLESFLSMAGLVHITLVDSNFKLIACNKLCMIMFQDATSLPIEKIIGKTYSEIYVNHPIVYNTVYEELNSVFESNTIQRFYKTLIIEEAYSLTFLTLRMPICDNHNKRYILSLSQPINRICNLAAKRLGLSKREFSCINGILDGKTHKQIAKELKISHRTVESHIEKAKSKLGCFSKDELIVKAGKSQLQGNIGTDGLSDPFLHNTNVFFAKK